MDTTNDDWRKEQSDDAQVNDIYAASPRDTEIDALRAEIALLRDGQAAAEAERDAYRAALVPFAEAGEDGEVVEADVNRPLCIAVRGRDEWVYVPVSIEPRVDDDAPLAPLLRVNHLRAAADALKGGKP